jgi:hypothetical protein
MGRIFKFHHNNEYNFVDLGNIKSINTSDYGTCVNIYFLKGFEYVVNPKSGECELLEPYIQFSFNNNKQKFDFAKNISEEWEKYLEGKEIDK